MDTVRRLVAAALIATLSLFAAACDGGGDDGDDGGDGDGGIYRRDGGDGEEGGD